MDGLTVKYNELTADEFTEIWQSVWGDAPDSRLFGPLAQLVRATGS